VTQFVILGENKPGTLAQISSELAKVAVNITGIHGFAGKRARPRAKV
jgi:predicted amino acid-binding ACT domain protein